MNKSQKKILLYGTLGSIGATITILADLLHTHFQGTELNYALTFSFLALFAFPLWFFGIWIIYQGLKPAGVLFSKIPCMLFIFYTSTIMVFYHSSYPYKASVMHAKVTASDPGLTLLDQVSSDYGKYIDMISTIDTFLQLVICIWIISAILFKKTYFPKWIVLFVPIFPFLGALLLNLIWKGYFNLVEPFLACVPMLLLFILCTCILYKREIIIP